MIHRPEESSENFCNNELKLNAMKVKDAIRLLQEQDPEDEFMFKHDYDGMDRIDLVKNIKKEDIVIITTKYKNIDQMTNESVIELHVKYETPEIYDYYLERSQNEPDRYFLPVIKSCVVAEIR
jgi:DNA-binding NtrC family response regulator